MIRCVRLCAAALAFCVLASVPKAAGGRQVFVAAQFPDGGLPGRSRATKSARIERAMNTYVDFEGADDPKVTLGDLLKKHFPFPFEVEDWYFRVEGVRDVLGMKLQSPEKPLPEGKYTRASVLKRLLARIPAPSGATYVIRDNHVEITTGAAWLRELGLPPDLSPGHLIEQRIRNVPLRSALATVLAEVRERTLYDARLGKKADAAVSANLRQVPLDAAVELLTDMAGLAAVDCGGVWYVTTPENAARLKKEIFAQLRAGVNDPDFWPGNVGEGKKRLPREVTLEKLFDAISDDAKVTVLLDPRVKKQAQAKVKIDGSRFPVDVALLLLADMGGMGVAKVKNAYYVTSPENAARLRKQEVERVKARKKDE